ncbi:MAG: hypothetical protein GY679_02040 [Mycoplasma sp.]|nr:hypothetical protein [Mycoplasma sp.]
MIQILPKLDNYQELANRTVNRKLTDNEQLQNFSFGLMNEVTELYISLENGNRDEVIDEFGDVMWYSANLLSELEIRFSKLEVFESIKAVPNVKLLGSAIDISECAKKHFYQGHPLDVVQFTLLIEFFVAVLFAIAETYNINIEEVLKKNQEKLLKRYPEGFDKSKSINR